MNERPSLLPLFAVGAVAAALDLVTKWWVFDTVPYRGSRTVIDGFFLISPHFNPAGPWSFGLGLPRDALRFLLPLVSVVAVVALVWIVLRSDPRDRVKGIGFALILGGALGNLWDRAFAVFDPAMQGVRDFLLFKGIWFGNDFPAFNLADTWITVGVALVAWRILRESPEGEAAAATGSVPEAARAAGVAVGGGREVEA